MSGERRVFNLRAARADDWFEKVATSAPNFEQLCDAIGRKYVAFALVAGVRITALAIDPRHSDNTQVTFAIGDHGEEHTMALPDFRRALTQALVQPDDLIDPPSDLSNTEAVQRYLGVRYLLLAPIFGISVHELRVGGDKSRSPHFLWRGPKSKSRSVAISISYPNLSSLLVREKPSGRRLISLTIGQLISANLLSGLTAP